jgi:K+-sensing histidine kinase KdpD
LGGAVLLFVIASIVTSVAAQSRRRAMEASEAAERAQALQALAHTVIEGRSQSQILHAEKAYLSPLGRVVTYPRPT